MRHGQGVAGHVLRGAVAPVDCPGDGFGSRGVALSDSMREVRASKIEVALALRAWTTSLTSSVALLDADQPTCRRAE